MYFGCKDTNKNCKYKDKSQKYCIIIAKKTIKSVSLGQFPVPFTFFFQRRDTRNSDVQELNTVLGEAKILVIHVICGRLKIFVPDYLNYTKSVLEIILIIRGSKKSVVVKKESVAVLVLVS